VGLLGVGLCPDFGGMATVWRFVRNRPKKSAGVNDALTL
jgi:hypothetical protein